MKKWKKKSSQIILDDKFMRVKKDLVELPSGDVIPWIYWDSKDSAMVIGMTGQNKLIMIKQYKYLVNDYVLEFPSGGMEKDEEQAVGAARELKEETGYQCSRLEKLGSFYETFSQLNRQIHVFFGSDAKSSISSPDSGEKGYEDIEVLLIDYEECLKLVKENKIVSMGSCLAILLLKEKIEAKKSKLVNL